MAQKRRLSVKVTKTFGFFGNKSYLCTTFNKNEDRELQFEWEGNQYTDSRKLQRLYDAHQERQVPSVWKDRIIRFHYFESSETFQFLFNHPFLVKAESIQRMATPNLSKDVQACQSQIPDSNTCLYKDWIWILHWP